MRRILSVIVVSLLSLSSVMGQMIPVNLPADGNWPTVVGDSIMLIGPRQNELTEEQRYFNPVYLLVYPGKEHLKEQMIRAALCDCDPAKPNRRIGVFSVAPDKQVSFSQGNLQYLPAANIWKFADTQYEYRGNANKYLKPTFRNWVDLFGWSANNTTAPFGVSTSTNAADYAGDFVDWGTNTICGDAPNTWRTLSRDEWEYLLNGRENAQQLRTKGSVEGKEGVILLPDSWICPEGYTIAIIPDEANLQPNVNTYSQADWSKLEDAGAIILPSAGMRRNAIEVEVRHPNIFGGYWTCTNKDEHNSYCYTFHTQDCEYVDYSNHIYGRSVRLVHDTIVPQTIPDPCLVVKVNDTLSINMMCVEGGTFMMGAMEGDTQANANEKPAHEVTLSDYYMSDVQVSQALWEYVMGTTIEEEVAKQNGEQNIGKGPNYPMYSIDWFLANEFAAKLSQLTGLQFSLPTEAEWEYAARGGQLSRGYKFAGSNNLDEIAWWGDPKGLVHPSAQKKPNELGIYDMCGNICEWTLDGYSEYTNEAQTDPLVPRVDYVVQRSMSSYSTWKEADHRVTFRYKKDPKVARTRVGFRLVLHDTVPTSPEPEYVDLGLSVKWATFNVGATSPEDYGDYLAWGETEPKETYSWATYKWGTSSNLTKYNTTDGKTILDLDDDAAYVNWGDKWRMPSKEEVDELTQQCSWIWTTHNNVNGYKVTGPNGNSIFLPAAGYKGAGPTYPAGEDGLYWTNTTEKQHYSYLIVLHDDAPPTQAGRQGTRCFGFAVRAVYDDRPPKRIGVFSVAADKQVSFSQGNLQYTQSTDTWQFAREQYEYIGAENIKDGALADKIDLFGWSGKDSKVPYGVGVSSNYKDYQGEFVDWGTKLIHGDAKDTWRTLSIEEWEYIYHGRKNADQLLAIATLEGVPGLILLPDNWQQPEDIPFVSSVEQGLAWDATRVEGSYFDASNKDHTKDNIYTQAQWQKMEALGAVFLPCAGWRQGKTWLFAYNGEIKSKYLGSYWSCTIPQTSGDYYFFRFTQQEIRKYSFNSSANPSSLLARGRSVRLVHDTIVPETIPEPCLVVKVNDTLSINMMCVEGGTFTMGDGENAHPVSLSSYSIDQTEVTQALWEAVMGTNPSANTTNKELPVTNISWYDCQAFIKKLNQQTGMRFRLPTEAEWEYASRGGQKSKGYTYAGSNDLKEVAWYNGNSGNTLHPVAQKKPNELGIYDMSGNAWEWCHDWHAPYPTTHQYNPLGPEVGKVVGKRYLRVFRGGSYGYEAAYHQNAFRDITGPEPNIGTSNLGLRLVLSDEVNFQTIHVNDTLSFHMMDVKGGTFTMGDNNISIASPAHQVTLSDYYIGETEVTQALWKSVMGNIPTGNKNPSYPVGYVTYADCQNFIAKLNNLTGLHFQLPTEAEWEYAAMGGNKSHNYIYSGSNTIDDVAWYDQNSENKMHNVGVKQPNELGIYDMSGNAWEWCADYYDKYTADPKNDPKGPTTGTGRVIRSGSFRTTAERCSNKHRQAREADYPDSHITFRLVLHDTEPAPEPEYVDLGLSVKWATFNVGATSPEDYGDYFAWGETEPKETYSWATYKWGTSSKITKYNATDGKTILDPEDDAAQVHWGGDWRMPTEEEQEELIDRCSWERTNLNGVIGYKVTGPNGNSIFIPIAGAYNSFDNQLNSVGSIGWIYSSTIATEIRAYEIHIEEGVIQQKDCSRCVGLTIRPVYDNRPSKRIGVFSVAADKQVSFSQGNLQYTQSTDEWRFAREQYDYIGKGNITNGQLGQIIDMFGWSADADPANKWGVTIAKEGFDGDFVDWGLNYIHGEAPGSWRTLSQDEWSYLLSCRQHATELWGVAQVAGVNGVIILPDRWSPTDDLPFVAGINENGYAAQQTLSVEQWQLMEELGAVFLPAAGGRDGASLAFSHIDSVGWYWLSTPTEPGKASCVRFECNLMVQRNGWRQAGLSVRLVHDTIVLEADPEYVDLGLSVKWATFNVGATSPEDYGDYFAWGETEPKDIYSWTNYKWCDGDYTKLNKYCTKEQYGIVDNQTILQACDDAAYTKLGGNWRMPNIEECQELVNMCTWTWTTINGINGHLITGPNGNTIFLPATGAITTSGLQNAGVSGYYWINSISTTNPYNANDLYNRSSNTTMDGSYGINAYSRYIGRPIRPVYDDRPPKRIGVFSVGADKQVSFSQGNLQYVQSTDTWQFAANQLEYMGHKHYRNGQLADTIEYFGWSGKNSKTPWGISLSTESSDYAGEFLDWGTNSIAGSAPNTWRTLSNEELLYICQGRKNADQLLGLGTIGTVTGLIILPDDWQLPAGLSFTPNTDNATKNQYTYNQWAVMENAGAVFLPPTGYFNHKLTNMRGVNELGHYRGSTLADDGRQIYMLYANSRIRYSLSGNNDGNLYYAFSVRLVHDTIVPEPEYVDLGLSVKWATFNVGATSSNEIGNFYAWGEIEPKDTYTVNNYKWWNKSSKEITKYCTIDSLAYGDVADGLTELLPQDDVAHILKGEHWRMPNLNECKELVNGCTWTVSTRQGQIGFEGTSKINGNTIFLPVAGFRAGANLVHETLGGYWSSTLNIEKQSCARGLYLNQETPAVNIYYNSNRQNGFLVRPVYDDRVK